MALNVYTVRDYTTKQGENKSAWTRIGRAFINRDGSTSVMLDALPLNGRLIIREEEQRQQNGHGGQQHQQHQQQDPAPGGNDNW